MRAPEIDRERRSIGVTPLGHRLEQAIRYLDEQRGRLGREILRE